VKLSGAASKRPGRLDDVSEPITTASRGGAKVAELSTVDETSDNSSEANVPSFCPLFEVFSTVGIFRVSASDESATASATPLAGEVLGGFFINTMTPVSYESG
jgi:hypothetical protein